MPIRNYFAILCCCLIATSLWAQAVPALPQVAPVPAGIDSSCVAGRDTLSIQSEWTQSLLDAGFAQIAGASPWLARISLTRQASLCNVKVSLTPPDFGAVPIELAQDFLPADSAALRQLFQGAAAALARTVWQRTTGSLLLECSPSPASARAAGLADLPCPGNLDQVPPGVYALQITRPGYNSITDSVTITAGRQTHKTYQLAHSQAWLDSVNTVQASARRDSLLAAAQANPAKSLPELFQRLFAIPLPAGTQSVAILPFAATGVNPDAYEPGLMAAEYATAQVVRDSRFHLVERAALDKVLAEQTLVQAGLTSDSAAARSGRLAAAQYLVVGTVAVQGNVQHIFARLVHVETGTVVSAAAAQVGNDNLRELYLENIGERTQISSTVFRSSVAPGWGHFYANRPVRGAIWSTLAIGAIGYTAWRTLEYRDAQSTLDNFENHDPSSIVADESGAAWLARANSAVTDRNDAATQLNIALGILGAVWIGNILDAWWVGSQESQRIQTKYFNAQASIAPYATPTSTGILLAGRF